MKKNIYILGLLVLFMTASCGNGKWSCKKRYCKTIPINNIEQNDCPVALTCELDFE